MHLHPLRTFKQYVEHNARLVGRGTAIHLSDDKLNGTAFRSDSGDCRWIIHSAANQGKNNEIRTAFLKAVINKTNLSVDKFPPALKTALKIDDFGFKNGKATSGKPLTAYRMQQVFKALDNPTIKDAIAKASKDCNKLAETIKTSANGIIASETSYNMFQIRAGVDNMREAYSVLCDKNAGKKEREAAIGQFAKGWNQAWCESGLANSIEDEYKFIKLRPHDADSDRMLKENCNKVKDNLNKLANMLKERLTTDELQTLENKLGWYFTSLPSTTFQLNGVQMSPKQ